ncbi:MAG: putative Metal-dependent hydrolases of the beta-lactamase superfamily II [Promethearchaeota archaeon]|nr:MAG: putative Metal-dependent hydrolases of the beta-lactamase superfamily II [Candidatus Lokiarchaeota archaeon]
MMQLDITVLTNNVVIPFQKDVHLSDKCSFSVNKLFTTKSIAEHGLGFLISLYKRSEESNSWDQEVLFKFIFDLGGDNLSFLHNLDVRGIPLYDIDVIALSHWHYDHIGGLYKVLERIEREVPIYTHPSAKSERFFKRSAEITNESLKNKTREELLPYLKESKIVNQAPINLGKVNKLNGEVEFLEKKKKLFENEGIKILLSGEIPRIYEIEDFSNYYSLQGELIKEDKILDDKCLIIEFNDHIVLVNGCCHSGLMNTIDYVKKEISKKPISHIIGGFHMASASENRQKKTIKYLETFQNQEQLCLFPIHCTGEEFIHQILEKGSPHLLFYNISVGTTLSFILG